MLTLTEPTLRNLTAGQAAAELAEHGFASIHLHGSDNTYGRILIAQLEKGTDEPDIREAIAYTLARLTGIDTIHPAVCTGCGAFLDRAFTQAGRCPDCS